MSSTQSSFRRFTLAALLLAGLAACSGDKDPDKDALAPDEPVDALYTKGTDALNSGDYKEAGKQFAEVERQHPYSQWATHAQIMEAYASYLNLDYDEAIKTLDQFIELHPGNTDIAYAYYLRALCNYERISDVRRDQTAARESLKGLQDIITRFPDTSYAKDATLKIALINDHLAGAEMEVGRYYVKQHLYIAAIGRFKTVVDKYQTTSHVPEALERLVECYVALGLLDEAKKNASVLGYNFPGSDWYQDAYNLLADRGVAPARKPGDK
ncbi:MAG: outer membrane protein assembly factor BamD [Alphaproteobacteria bacterium]|nr:outer membrane protein assembly factor BamD [Alphaproteobacteria bacterium]